MNSIDKLTEYFAKFPGIGPRQAKRFVYFLLTKDRYFIEDLTNILLKLKEDISECLSCHRLFSTPKTAERLCTICQSQNTSKETLMIVEKDVDLENINKSGIYNGRYFVLGGLIPILEENPVNRIRARFLLEEIEKQAKENELREVIIALSVNLEGENTTNYIKKILESLVEKFNLKISILGRGLSTGTELEYSDSDTIRSALDGRK